MVASALAIACLSYRSLGEKRGGGEVESFRSERVNEADRTAGARRVSNPNAPATFLAKTIYFMLPQASTRLLPPSSASVLLSFTVVAFHLHITARSFC